MTIGKLHKILSEMVKKGHSRKRVCVSKETFTHPLEWEGVTTLDVVNCRLDWVLLANDDGGIAQRRDGTERRFAALVLTGNKGKETSKEGR